LLSGLRGLMLRILLGTDILLFIAEYLLLEVDLSRPLFYGL
jgi:hypothetical protein